MKQVNIPSKKPYYCKENGELFDSNRERITGTYDKKNDIHVLSYTNVDGVENKIPLTRLMYTTFKPDIDIKGYTITRKNTKDVFRYGINNLVRISNKEMPKKNNIAKQPPLSISDRTFYLDFKPEKVKELIENINVHTLTHVAKIYGVSPTSIARAKKKLIL